MNKERKNFSLVFIFYLSLATILTWFTLGLENLSVTSIKWFFNGTDITTHYIGWVFFKNDIWRFPIGAIPNYGIHIPNSIVFSDSIPLLAIFFKAFKSFLPNNFQYFSFWIFICFFLQSLFGFLILFHYTKNKIYSLIGSIFFTLAPIFIFRLGMHLALAGQWIILSAFYIETLKSQKTKNFYWTVILSLSTFIHFYLTATLFVMFFIFIFEKMFKQKNYLYFLKQILLSIFFTTLVMFILGYFDLPVVQSMSLGYGISKLNLLGLFDPYPIDALGGIESWSNFLPDIPGMGNLGEFEGFNYLGIGGIFLFLFLLYDFLKSFSKKNNSTIKYRSKLAYLILALLFSLWSISTNVSLGNIEILNIPLNKYLYGPLSILRSTGRLFWPVYYLIFIASIILIYRKYEIKKSIYILVALLSLQIIDTSAGLKQYLFSKKFVNQSKQLNDQIWYEISTQYPLIRTTFFTNSGRLFKPMANFLASGRVEKTDIIHVGRYDRSKTAETRYKLFDDFKNKKFPKKTVFIVDNNYHLLHLKHLFQNKKIGFVFRDKTWIMLPDSDLMNDNDRLSFEKITANKLLLNKKIDLNFNNKIKNNFLGMGWSHNLGNKGIWSEGNFASLLFSVDNNDEEKFYLEIECKPNISLKNPNLLMSVLVNEKPAKIINFEYKGNNNFEKVKIEIEKSEEKYFVVDFLFSNPRSPLSLMQSPDGRRLGILLKSIYLSKKE